MFESIREFLQSKPDVMTKEIDGFQPKQIAAAALMVEAARIDGDFDEDERSTMVRLAVEQLGVSEDQAGELLAIAERSQRATYSNWLFTETIKEAFSHEERVRILEMICEVTYADGLLDKFEASMLERVAEMVHVSPEELNEAQGRVQKKLGIN